MAPTELENLRILSETAAHLRAAPESRWAKRRRDEALRWAGRSHSVQDLATAAGVSVDAVTEILGGSSPRPDGAESPSRERRWARAPLPARFRTVR